MNAAFEGFSFVSNLLFSRIFICFISFLVIVYQVLIVQKEENASPDKSLSSGYVQTALSTE